MPGFSSTRSFGRLAASLELAQHRRQQAMAVTVLRELVESTPVVTGRSRANWQVGLDRAPAGELDQLDPSGEATIAAGEAVIAAARPGQSIHIVNNLPHMQRLNDGDASSAPAGFVERALMRGRLSLNGPSQP